MKKIALLSLIISLFVSNTYSQLKVQNDGKVGVGTFTPFAKFHVVGDAAIFTKNTNYPTSCAFIRCNNDLSNAITPDFTWYNNDQTGLFHPSGGIIGFSINGAERMRITPSGLGIGCNPYYTLDVSGYIRGWNLTPSDKRLKSNILPLGRNLETLNKLNGVSYTINLTNTKLKREVEGSKQYGFIAQDLQKVLPELVHQDSSGYLSVDYTSIIPIIVEALKEQNKTIDSLKSKISSLENKQLHQSGLNSSDAILYQNVPNPFNKETEIAYYMPEHIANATIYVYDMQGNQIKSIPIHQRGKSSETINGAELHPGMYLYTLIADGKEIDTKRMILTN